MSYSITSQRVVEKLESVGFEVEEDFENSTLLHCRKNGCKEIVFKQNGDGHMFKVLTKYTTKIEKAMEWAGVKMEDVA
ncbi:hypothetical protein Q5O14_16400 [Eubacteriaceae bacterium ES2]|nr:hypothetical protein Q5O14_16400 [Eubacteriaceae bacterium ES2]